MYKFRRASDLSFPTCSLLVTQKGGSTNLRMYSSCCMQFTVPTDAVPTRRCANGSKLPAVRASWQWSWWCPSHHLGTPPAKLAIVVLAMYNIETSCLKEKLDYMHKTISILGSPHVSVGYSCFNSTWPVLHGWSFWIFDLNWAWPKGHSFVNYVSSLGKRKPLPTIFYPRISKNIS